MVSKSFKLDVDLWLIGYELEWASADWMCVEIIITLFGDVFRWNDHRAVTGKLGDQHRIWRLEVKIDGLFVDDFDLFDCDIVGTLRTFRAFLTKQTIKSELHRFCVEWLAIVELHTFTQIEADAFAFVEFFPRRCQTGTIFRSGPR